MSRLLGCFAHSTRPLPVDHTTEIANSISKHPQQEALNLHLGSVSSHKDLETPRLHHQGTSNSHKEHKQEQTTLKYAQQRQQGILNRPQQEISITHKQKQEGRCPEHKKRAITPFRNFIRRLAGRASTSTKSSNRSTNTTKSSNRSTNTTKSSNRSTNTTKSSNRSTNTTKSSNRSTTTTKSSNRSTNITPTIIMINPGMVTEGSNNGVGDAGFCAWDPNAARLLKMVDNENLEGLQALLEGGIHVNGHGGSFHETALHRAAQICWATGVRYLLSAGASVYAKNQFGQTPLHYAAASKSTACIKLLLESGRPGVLDHRDMRGHTPLHDASASGCVNAITTLLKAGALIRAKDGNGETPLHKAARAQSIPAMLALLNAGADMSACDSNGESVLSYTLHHFPGTMDAVFDYCLVTNSPRMNTKTLEVTMNFLPLTCSEDKNQVQNLQSFVGLGHAKLLSHPLCETFLLLKWMNVRRLFLIEVILYVLFAVVTTLLTFNKFVWKNVSSNNTSRPMGCGGRELNESKVDKKFSIVNIPDEGVRALQGIVITYLVAILIQQFLSLLQNKMAWFRSLSGVLHVIITILVMSVVLPPEPHKWQHHLASCLMLLMWTECMLLIGRFPNCGIYVVMFTRVAKVFLRIFLIYFCLLLAFSAAFYVTLHDPETDTTLGEKNVVFSNPIFTFIKTLTMMIGELDFDDNFVCGLNNLYVTGQAIFVLFVILVSIILSNLLVALAVNDVQGLRNSAHLERLIKQTELVFHMEKNFSIAAYIANYVKIPTLCDMLMKIANVCNYDCYNTRVYILPNNPKKFNKLFIMQNKKYNETTLPSHLVTHVNQCLRTRETETSDNKSSTRTKRGSRIRRGEFHRNADEDIKSNIKELEANMIEIVSEKMEDMADTHSLLNKRITALEEKLDKVVSLLLKNDGDNAPADKIPLSDEGT
nr:transient receptor potential channel pyrexia-like [Procambarus clarkii]XP_045618310.1 transient receptor potential channel pyrexia-like [Procambarus clarkii]XP_045618311.1 transient receptor potential channel pyrexia-like [Procambarus clarkii]